MNIQSQSHPAKRAPPARADMVWIDGCAFTMGSDSHYPEERPSRAAHVEGFWIDRTPVTNQEFGRFVEATGHITFAEQAPLAEDYPGAPPENLQAGSMVFDPPAGLVALDGPPLWWAFIAGADWRHPLGHESSIAGRETHPVLHVALVDVEAYAAWAGASIPTEAEWEFAAQGGLSDKEFAWGDELEPGGIHMANVWQGAFPYNDRGDDGWKGTSPVGTYPPNGYGLNDMIGNVWEWTADWWTTPDDRTSAKKCCSASRNGSACADDPLHIPRRVLKGGSHLCAPNYCRRYRPAARHAHPIDTSTSHIGFRCVIRP
jgi:formylglycine-generating enzyme required for sulfatase activity